MDPLIERVFRAKLRMELEPTDLVFKNMLVGQVFSNTSEMFQYLRGMHERFWAEMQAASQLVYDWAQYLQVPDPIANLRAQIWTNFLCRLSLDARLVTGKTPAESHGNEVLAIIVETVETTLLSRLSLTALLQRLPEVQRSPEVQPSRAHPPPQAFFQSAPFQEKPTEPGELYALQRSMHTTALPSLIPPGAGHPPHGANPRGPPGSMQIRLVRTKPESEYAVRKKTKPRRREKSSKKGSRSRLSRYDDDNDGDDNDEEEEDDDDDDDDMIAKAEERRRI